MAKKQIEKLENVEREEKAETVVIAGKTYYTLYHFTKDATFSERHIKEEIKRGNLRAYKPGKLLLFIPQEVEKWITKKVA